jgi:hypothetical protein
MTDSRKLLPPLEEYPADPTDEKQLADHLEAILILKGWENAQ